MRFTFLFLFLFSVTAFSVDETSLRDLFEQHGVSALEDDDYVSEGAITVELGKLLFFDKLLSGNKNISCATCHHPTAGTSDGLPVPIGTGGEGLGALRVLAHGNLIPRNAPAAFNLTHKDFHTTMWDGRIAKNPVNHALQTPEPQLNGISPVATDFTKVINSVAVAQAMFPVTSHHEMRGQAGENEVADAKDNFGVWSALMKRLVGDENGGGVELYKELFKKAYPETEHRDLVFAHAARAMAAFEGWAFKANQSAFDQFMRGG